MDNKLHNDGLEDFLRKSFEQYDDSPSDGLWDKINADLADEPKVVPISAGKRWWMAAAAAVLLALVAGQYLYFQKEKAELVEIINGQSDKIEWLEKELINKEKEISEIYKKENNSGEAVFNKKNKPSGNTENKVSNQVNLKENKSKVGHTILEQPKFVENKNIHLPKIDEPNLIENKNDAEIVSEQQRTTTPNPIGLVGLKNIEQPNPDLFLPTMKIDPVQHKGHFSIGVHHTYLSSREKMARVIQRPMGGPNRTFNNTRAMTGTTQMTGISAIYQTKSNWLLESGVNYRSTMLSTKHRAQLRFMDRQPNGSNQQYDFQYALNTSAGLVDIEVRADQSDPTQTIDEFENIIIEIEAKQKVDYVSIPFLVGKQIGHGRLNATVKSGVLINFLTHQSFDISGNIINNRLQNSRAMHSRRNGFGLKNTTADFMAILGLNYELNRKWDAHISPTFVVPMGSRLNDPYIKSSGISAGVDIGVRFKF